MHFIQVNEANFHYKYDELLARSCFYRKKKRTTEDDAYLVTAQLTMHVLPLPRFSVTVEMETDEQIL